MITRLFILTIVISAMFAAPAFSASKLYTDESGKYSFKFSGDWRKLEDEKENIDGHFVLADKDKAVAEVIITHQVPEKKMSLAEFLAKEKARIEKTENYTKINEKTDFKIGGYPAAWILVNAKEKDVSGHISITKLSQYFIRKDDEFWGITAITSEDNSDLILKIERTIVKSFEFSTGAKIALDPLVEDKITSLQDPHKRYSIKAPESWKVIPTDGPELALESSVGKMYVFSLPLDEEDALLKQIAGDFITKHEVLKKSHIISESPLDIGTEKGHVINYEGSKSGYPFHVQLAVIVKDSTVFYNYFISSPVKWKRSKALITRIQSSFSFIKEEVGGEELSGLPEFLGPVGTVNISTVEQDDTKLNEKLDEMSEVSGKLLWEPLSKDNIPR